MELSEIEEKLCESPQDLLAPFSCHICPFRSPEKYSLQRHFQNRHSLTKVDVNIVFPCQLCNKLFKKKSYLITHLVTHPKLCAKPYICSICNATFTHMVQLERHHLSHEYDLTRDPNEVTVDDMHNPKKVKIGLFHCTQCSLGFESLELLEKHKRRHIETIFTPPSLSSSIKATVASSSSSIVCKNEPLTFKSSSSKISSSSSSSSNMPQDKKKKSKIGSRSNSNKKNLQQQEPSRKRRMHVYKKVLYCPYCPSKFSNKSGMGITNLNIHLVIKHKDTLNATPHTDLHKCPRCVKLFTSNQSLNVHILKKHGTNDSVRPTTTTTSPKKTTDYKKNIKKNKNTVADRNAHESLDKKKTFVLPTSTAPRKKCRYLIRGDDGGASSCSENLSVKQSQERKSRFRKRIFKKRAQLAMKKKQKTNTLSTTTTTTTTPSTSTGRHTTTGVVKSINKLETTISSSDDFDLASSINLKRARGRPPNTLEPSTFKRVGGTTQSSSPSFKSFKRTGRGRPPGSGGKVISGRIVKKYKCKHCSLNYLHLPSFITHQKLCSTAAATAAPPPTSTSSLTKQS